MRAWRGGAQRSAWWSRALHAAPVGSVQSRAACRSHRRPATDAILTRIEVPLPRGVLLVTELNV
ncbi:hypothetical protein E2C01_088531 [Portunus trituberculatus]|uniref:Uncharacterized protein n=1 Tax=Portunus trituberculatus TaxID=210409 RepID=A0A5B7JGU8_PORTR|nr:hypothetical protein [Portunus trituberculatus]